MIDQFLAGTGALTIIVALSAWLSKVWANRILQKDRVRYETQMETLLQEMRTRGEKDVFVHRLQFEKEFRIYLTLWKAVLRASRAAAEYRSLTTESGKSAEQTAEDLGEAINRAKVVVYDRRPFYAPRVYGLTCRLLDTLKKVHRRARHLGTACDESTDTERLLDEVNAAVPAICDAIRERVFSTVVPAEADVS